MDIAAGLAALNGSLNIIKAIQGIDKGLNEAEYKIKISELYSSLADAKMALTDAQIELYNKDGQIAELIKNNEFETELILFEGHKYLPHYDGSPSGKPYCPVCEINEGKFFLTHRKMRQLICPNCKVEFEGVKSFQTKESREAQES